METKFLQYRQVTEEADLLTFIANYFVASGNLLSLEFLQNAIVYQGYDGDRAVTGFALNVWGANPLRTISYIDTLVIRQIMADENLSELDMLEVGANYVLKSVGKKARVEYYRVMAAMTYQYAVALDKRYILAGSIIRALQVLHQLLMKRVIYYGPVSTARQADVREGNVPVLKVYVTETKGFKNRATLAMLTRYVLIPINNRIRKFLNWQQIERTLKLPQVRNGGWYRKNRRKLA